MVVALVIWGNVIEDFLDSLDISLEKFCVEMTGSWVFGYVEALKRVNITPLIICVSSQTHKVTRYTHKPSQVAVLVLPASALYRLARWLIELDQNHSFPITVLKKIRQPFLRSLKDIEPYLATPIMALKRVLRQEKCELIVCQEYEYPRFDVCVLLGKWLNLPVFATFQGGNFQVSRLEAYFRPHALNTSQGLIVATQTEIDRLGKAYDLEQCRLAKIPNPLDIEAWGTVSSSVEHQSIRKQVRQEIKISYDSPIVIWHGRVDIYRKGLDILLEAWSEICARSFAHPPYLLIVGTGHDAEKFQTLISQQQCKHLIWINEYILDRQQVGRYLLASDLYVMSSRNEGFPVAPLEAMACGLPIVATEVPGIPDILEGGEQSGGIQVPWGDASRLAEAIARLLNDRQLRLDMGNCARRRVEDNYSLLAVGQALQNFLFSG